MQAGWRRVLLAGGLSAAMGLCTLGLQPLHRALAHDDGIHGPYVGAPASPAIVDLRIAPRGTGHRQPPILPDLYPGGQARLDREKAAAMQLPPSPGMRPPSAAAPGALAAASIIPGAGFDGIDAAESFCACQPPDGAIAASPTYLLATVNTAFAMWDKSGHPLLSGPTSLSGLFGGCLATYPHMSDPFTDYDAADQRFVLGILTFDDGYNSSICLAVSQTSDPTTQWNVYSFPVSSTPNNYLLDFPRPAIAANAIYVGGNLFHYQPGNPLCPHGFCFLGAGLYAYGRVG